MEPLSGQGLAKFPIGPRSHAFVSSPIWVDTNVMQMQIHDWICRHWVRFCAKVGAPLSTLKLVHNSQPIFLNFQVASWSSDFWWEGDGILTFSLHAIFLIPVFSHLHSVTVSYSRGKMQVLVQYLSLFLDISWCLYFPHPLANNLTGLFRMIIKMGEDGRS